MTTDNSPAAPNPSLATKGWIGVDLDGTLAFYDPAQWPAIGAPIEPIQKRVLDWLSKGVEVRIVTARVCSQHPAPEIEAQKQLIAEWCAQHLGAVLQVTAEKDMHMVMLWDDRAVEVQRNTGNTIVSNAVRAVQQAWESAAQIVDRATASEPNATRRKSLMLVAQAIRSQRVMNNGPSNTPQSSIIVPD